MAVQPSADPQRLGGMTLFLGRRARLASTALLAATLAAGALAGAGAAPAAASATVIHFTGVHVVHDRATARAFLPGTPRAFRAFAAAQGAKVRREAAAQAGAQLSCVRHSGITVSDFAQDSPAGYAIGSVGACGGYAALWTNATRGATGTTLWREVVGTQDGWYCPDLKRYRVPSALVGETCYAPKLRAEKPYHQD